MFPSQVFTVADLENLIRAIDVAQRSAAQPIANTPGGMLIRYGFESALEALSTALGLPYERQLALPPKGFQDPAYQLTIRRTV